MTIIIVSEYSVAHKTLVRYVCNAGCIIEMVVALGDAVLDSTAILRVLGCRSHLLENLKEAIWMGDERTFEQDPQ